MLCDSQRRSSYTSVLEPEIEPRKGTKIQRRPRQREKDYEFQTYIVPSLFRTTALRVLIEHLAECKINSRSRKRSYKALKYTTLVPTPFSKAFDVYKSSVRSSTLWVVHEISTTKEPTKSAMTAS